MLVSRLFSRRRPANRSAKSSNLKAARRGFLSKGKFLSKDKFLSKVMRSRAMRLESLEDRSLLTAGFFQGFEANRAGWDLFAQGTPGFVAEDDATRVASGTNGITSSTGAFHAESAGAFMNGSGAFTPFGPDRPTGYTTSFPAGGYTTSIDIYLDINNAGAYANDTRFDWDSAINDAAGSFRRDFVFNTGFYNSTDLTGPGAGTDRFVISASNNATRSGAFPKNPARDPFAITTEGWYTFQHRFYDGGSGQMHVDLSIKNAAGGTIHTWTLTDPSDIIGTTVGGNRYGWYALQEFTVLAFDNSYQVNAPPNTAYVDDDWAGVPFGSDPDGGGPATFMGYDAFATIQGGVDGVAVGGTVNVLAGTYVENVIVNKVVSLVGAQAGVDARGRVANESTLTPAIAGNTALELTTGSGASIIDGFTFSGGTALGMVRSTASAVNDNLQILNNRFSGFAGAAIFLDKPGNDITINQNEVDGAAKTSAGALVHLDTDTFNGIFVTNNWVLNGATGPGLFVDGNRNVGPSGTRNPLISGNKFNNNDVGINGGSRAFQSATISNNEFKDNDFDGFQGGPKDSLITQNTFSGNDRWGLSLTSFGNTTAGRGAINNAVSENFFSNNTGLTPSGDILMSATQPAGNAASNTIFGNSLGSAVAISYSGSEIVNASGNWWGASSNPESAGKIAGTGASNVDYTPWLNSGVDTNLVTPGFQGDFSVLNVDDDSAQSGATGRIQEGVNLVTAGGTVHVAAGSYSEAVNVNKSVSLLGTGQGINPDSRTPAGVGESTVVASGGSGISIGAANVTVRGFSVTGGAGAVYGIAETTPLTGTNIRENFVFGLPAIGVAIAAGSSGFQVVENDVSQNYSGIYLSNSAFGGTVSANRIHDHSDASFTDAGSAITLEGVNPNNTIANNEITGNRFGIYVWTGFGSDLAGTAVSNNSITANSVAGVANTNAALLNASGNWWGTDSAIDIAGQVGVNVDYTPWLASDFDIDSAAGFQGDFSFLIVDDNSPQTGTTGRIQEGANLATEFGTVHVNAGVYHEDVTVTQALNLEGAGPEATTISGPIGGSVSTITVAASDVSIAGFNITRAGNNTADWNNPGLNSAGIAVQGQAINNLVVHDNLITQNRTGIDVNNSSGHTIRNNVISNNRTGLIFRNQTDGLTVVENSITNNWTVGIVFLDASGGTNSPVQSAADSTFSNNNLSGNWYGQIVDRQTGGSLPAPGANLKNFSGNWFGTVTPLITTANSTEPGYAAQIPVEFGGTAVAPGGQPDIAGAASANFDITPYLASGTDTNIETSSGGGAELSALSSGNGTYGFQGSFATVIVTSLLAQTGETGRIQEGIDLVDQNGEVKILAGLYSGDVDATGKTVNLAPGASPAQVTIGGTLTLDSDDTLSLELNGTNALAEFDNFIVNGDVTLDGAKLNLALGFAPAAASNFTIIDNDLADAVSGTFTNLPEGSTFNATFGAFTYGFAITYVGGDGNDVVLTSAAANPPTGITAFLSGSQLVVNGTASDDNITIDEVGGSVRVLDNGSVAFTFASGSVTSAYVSGNDGNDTITIDPSFGARNAFLLGDAGNDTLRGGLGNDYLSGGLDLDTFEGGNGHDQVVADAEDAGAGVGVARILGGAGSDTLNLSAETISVVFNNNGALTNGFETIYGTQGDDFITNAGSATGIYLVAGGGFDILVGGEGNDYIEGGSDDDCLKGNGGNDTLVGGAGVDTFDAGAGNDQVVADVDDTGLSSEVLTFSLASAPSILGGSGVDFLNFSAQTAGVTFNNNGTTTGGFETIYGGSGSDQITNAGTTTALYLAGFGGSDTLIGGAGNDYIDGGANDDSLIGSGGNDTLIGGAGADAFDGGGGNDQIFADKADTTALPSALEILGGSGADFLNFSAETAGVTFNNNAAATGGFETIYGSSGNDNISNAGSAVAVYLFGSAGDDTLIGGNAADIIEGHTGNDTLSGMGGGDSLKGGPDVDSADYSASPGGVVINLGNGSHGSGGDAQGDVFNSIENLIGSEAADYLYGTGTANLFDGRGGADLIYGDAGNDSLLGGSGNDFLQGGLGADTFEGEAGDDQIAADAADTTAPSPKILGGAGYDFLNFSAESLGVTFDNNGATTGGFEAIYGGAGGDNISNAGSSVAVYFAGFGGDDVLTGGEVNDYIEGGADNDSLLGNGGDDTLIGGNGVDNFDGGAGNDQIKADAADAAASSPKILGGVGFDFLNFAAETAGFTFDNNGLSRVVPVNTGEFEFIYGGSGNDTITNAGSTVAVFIYGFGGSDVLSGGQANDYLDGGLDNDTLNGNEGNDTLRGGPGADHFDGGAGTDTASDFNGGEGDTTTDIP